MDIFAEIKLMGDAYAGGFSCGLTMHGSETFDRMRVIEDTEDMTVWEDPDGVVLKLFKQKDGDALRLKTVVHNGSKKDITLEMLTSFAIRGVSADRIHRLQSFWSAEGKLRTETIEELHLEPSWNRCGLRIEKFGNCGSMPVRKYFPFLALENGESGKILGIQLYCASTWQIEIICKEDNTLTVTGGMGDRDFGHWTKTLKSGETFEAPEAVIAEGSDLYDVCDKLVKAQHPNISPEDRNMDIIFNEYCTTWSNPTFENVKKICDKLEGKGIKFLVIDSGWYGTSEQWWDQIGDWDVNEKHFPDGLKPIADYIRSKGMIPGIWFEFESVASGSKYYNMTEHLVKKDGVPLTAGGRRFWDMEDKWVINYLSEKVIGQLKNSGFGYIKVDYNDTMGIGCDGAEGLGESLRRKVEATKNFFRKIREEIPDIIIENCSSGGHRLEPSMLALASQASFSDAHEIVSVPLIAANLHRVMPPSQSQIWAVLRAGDTEDRIQYSLAAAMLGRMCISGDIYDLSEEQWETVDEGMDFYRKCSDVIKDGKTILHKYTTTAYNKPQGQQLVIRQLGNKYLAIMHRFENSEMIIPEIPGNAKILAQYGKGECDFSAKVWLYEICE